MDWKPVIPFEPISMTIIPSSTDWIAQIKWDGVRMLIYYDGQEVRLMNRRLHERTKQYPELQDIAAYCSASSIILDGEIIAFDQTKPSFHEVMKRDALRKSTSIAQAVGQTPIMYMVFDVLLYNGKWIVDRPLTERLDVMQQQIRPSSAVQLTESFPSGTALFDVMEQQGMEGIVCKSLSSTYAIGGKDSRWQKIKIKRDLYAVVGGVTIRDGMVNALLLGLYDQSRLLYIGHTGTGKLTMQDRRQLTEVLADMILPRKPFMNESDRFEDAIWIKPVLTVKVQYMEWTPHGTLRHPSMQAFVRMDPTACTFQQD